MPNWCENEMTISHKDPAMMQKALEAWNSGGFLGALVPEPDYSVTAVAETFPHITAQYAKTEGEKAAALANVPKIREDAWWDWRVQNWGTKWDIGWSDHQDKAKLDDDGLSMWVWFDSAWSPPVDAYAKLVELGYEIKAYYNENGCCFCGKFEDGQDQCYSIDIPMDADAAEWLEENIPADILNAFNLVEQYQEWHEQEKEDQEEENADN
jgi:hypothetical protein